MAKIIKASNKNSKPDRIKGSLMGLAVGDALGTTLEFRPSGTFPPLTDLIGGGVFNLEAGKWTDDTSMAMCLAESLINKHGFDPLDQMDNYVKWYTKGYWSSKDRCFDIGGATMDALEFFISYGLPYAGVDSRAVAGNGSLMRLAPIPLFYADNMEACMKYAALSSKTTHAAPQCLSACTYMASLIAGALNGLTKEELLSSSYEPVKNCWRNSPLDETIEEIRMGSFITKQPPQISGSGYVVKTLEAALWAFYHTSDFKSGALKVVNLGDDADTTGAVYGQLAGAFYGLSGIPTEWIKKIFRADDILSIAEKLYHLSDSKTTAQ